MKLFTRRNRKKMMKRLVNIGTFMVIVIAILGSSLQGVAATSQTNMINEKVIGIDLGTTQSVLAYSSDGRTIIIPNEQGNRLTPSMVSFKGNEILIGDAAYNQMTQNSHDTLFDVKRYVLQHHIYHNSQNNHQTQFTKHNYMIIT